ncbi:ACP S-malonyltransferase [Granulicella cerasi]|uniref:[acyl-carrier-protein] S-malonyltransferase n=1 Tax=Granulicella cerasi TaxID=741063 RepID=A0ABW1Z9P1_9BACT|nr:ACP S-malonyltransferase [Granulicella cerasi]
MSDVTNTTAPKQIALLFPGQGSQAVGMGREFFESYPAAREVFEEADDALGFPLSKLIFEGPEDDLKLTENTQPAILTMSIAAWRVLEPELKSRGFAPSFAAGHSLGEYSAHVAAGTFSFADAVRTVRARGQFMQSAVPAGLGAMAAVLGLDAERINDICASVSDELTQAPPEHPADPGEQAEAVLGQVKDGDDVSPAQAAARVSTVVAPANLNSPNQTVISGEKHAVEIAVERLKEAGASRTVMLPVSAPFHCALMQPAQDRLAGQLESFAFNDPALPVVANVDARVVRRGAEARDALIRQVTGAVRWVECIGLLRESGATHYIEVGPGKVLSGLNRQIDRALATTNVEDKASLEKTLATLLA